MPKVVPIKAEQPETHPAFTYKGHKIYNSYSFVDKDPVIDELRTVIEKSKLPLRYISIESGVSYTTLYNWLYGRTMRPQSATLEAVFRAIGYKRKVVRNK